MASIRNSQAFKPTALTNAPSSQILPRIAELQPLINQASYKPAL
jgi:hypothetical protein